MQKLLLYIVTNYVIQEIIKWCLNGVFKQTQKMKLALYTPIVCNSKDKWNHNEVWSECKEVHDWGFCKNVKSYHVEL